MASGNFQIWPQGQVKKGQKGQKRSIFKIQNFENKTHFSDSVSSQESNGVICFLCTMSINGPKMWFIFMTSPHFTLITVIWGSKIEIRIWTLACELLSCVSYTYNTVFWKFRKFWILEHFFQKNVRADWLQGYRGKKLPERWICPLTFRSLNLFRRNWADVVRANCCRLTFFAIKFYQTMKTFSYSIITFIEPF